MSSEEVGPVAGPEPMDVARDEGDEYVDGEDETAMGNAAEESVLDVTFETAHDDDDDEDEDEDCDDDDDEDEDEEEISDIELDCYPYTFSPLLLFAESKYFDKGHSNYNAVSQFFSPVLRNPDDPDDDIDMLHNVVYDRKNMLYEDLLNYVIDNECLVTCCIEAHFTAFKMFRQGKTPCLVHYDPMRRELQLGQGQDARRFAIFMMMKCNYGDGQHIQDNKDHYIGSATNKVRQIIYNLYKKINQVDSSGVYLGGIRLNLDRYVLFNQKDGYTSMSTQLTGNTCYFQTFLFALLCKAGKIKLSKDCRSVDIEDPDRVEEVATRISRFLLEFFVEETDGGRALLRPLTNSNFVCDFYRFKEAPYYALLTDFLRRSKFGGEVPDYEKQYQDVMQYYQETKCLHKYGQFLLGGATASSPNTKSLTAVNNFDGAAALLSQSDYYKYRSSSFMFGFNTKIMMYIGDFCTFNSFRKNQMLHCYEELRPMLNGNTRAIMETAKGANVYRDYYFMGQFEVGQQELIDLHHHTFLIDLLAEMNVDEDLARRVVDANEVMLRHTLFSTSKRHNYEKMLSASDFMKTKKFREFQSSFMSIKWFDMFCALGFDQVPLSEKEKNCLTKTIFYTTELMSSKQHSTEYDFEKEAVNNMARTSLRNYQAQFNDRLDMTKKYKAHAKIGHGFTYSKYNTLMHFLGVVQNYWRNPDLSNISVFGKDIRALLAISSQKIFFEDHHSGFYHYGPFEISSGGYYSNTFYYDLAVAQSLDECAPSVAIARKGGVNDLILTDRVYEFNYLKGILESVFESAGGGQFKTDNEVLNLSLLSLMLDFGLYQRFFGLLNLHFLNELQHKGDTKELQVEVANLIYEFDRKNSADSITRSRVEELIYETSYKFLVNKNLDLRSRQFKLIRMLNSDPDYQSYVLLVKIYMSLCNINKSVEVDYYKVKCDGEFRIIIPRNFSKITSEYLEEMSIRYTFSESNGIMKYDDLPIFDLRPHQPEIDLYRVRFDPATDVQSMVKYMEAANAFRVMDESKEQYIMFVADNALLIDIPGGDRRQMKMQVNNIPVEIATIFFNEAISFVPCFKYTDSEDVILFTSRNFHFHVDNGGQFDVNYYGMRHELIELLTSIETYVDLNDNHQFKEYKLSELLTESKTVFYFPDYLMQVTNRHELINLMDLAIRLRNIPFFLLVFFYLNRTSIDIGVVERGKNILGPWREAVIHGLGEGSIRKNQHYTEIFERQFFDLNQYQDLPLDDFIDQLCENFTKYQRFVDGQYQIIPRAKQREFLKRIICAEECFHFSEVGTGKTKVILPLLCQAFLSNNTDVHRYLTRGGKIKDTLIVLVPEHLLTDARAQVYRYCLNLNFGENYRVYDDIFALKHEKVSFSTSRFTKSKVTKQIFITSFNQLKKALTDDVIGKKMKAHREHVLIVADEVDDFLDRNKLVFNICSNMNNSFERSTLDLFYETSGAAYYEKGCPSMLVDSSENPRYWKQLYEKMRAIFVEIQDASRSINKSFGIFNEHTLRHCMTNISHDIEGYKSLIARPYESVNRAMSGSYYSDVERTIFLTFVILTEDITKYDELFQNERKFISYEYWNEHFIHQLDFDDLVYGHEKLSEICEKHPEAKDGLTRFLYEIILRRMEIRDKSRSVNSIDIIFNFDCIGFTGTPFLDNYPTAAYIRQERKDDIPDMIDRHFYSYTSEKLPQDEFQRRFALFQGQNSNVMVRYASSDFIRQSSDEMTTLEIIFKREEETMDATNVFGGASGGNGSGANTPAPAFNAIVDLCGIFKRSSIVDVAKRIKRHFGPDRFHYLYHIDQTDNSDRVLCLKTGNDIQYDEEFYKYLCKTYGADLRDRIFFFVDNRNVIGKDIPFQLVYQKHYGQALFTKSVVIAHDVDDFSKIWQAMGRSRTMNQTEFSIYKSDIPNELLQPMSVGGMRDIKALDLTRLLYVSNCDRKMAGNISSIYLTLIALFNLATQNFYYSDKIVNVFLDKMENTITKKVVGHENELTHYVLGRSVLAGILQHILSDKFKKSPEATVSEEILDRTKLEELLRQIVQQKYEQRTRSGDIFDDLILFLSGEQKSLMEISYTKQHQKQKQKQQNKNQDSDAMGLFDERHRFGVSIPSKLYFEESRKGLEDQCKSMLNMPFHVPILSLDYTVSGRCQTINVYPTMQFLYSHHIRQEYIDDKVRSIISVKRDFDEHYDIFIDTARQKKQELEQGQTKSESTVNSNGHPSIQDSIHVNINHVRQNPQYTIAAIEPGIYVIGMKDQFNSFDLKMQRLRKHVHYIVDEMGFVLFDRTASQSVDEFGPYFIEQYIIMELLSKHEVAQNVLDYYRDHKETLQRGLKSYDEKQGKGFVCWRFLINETAKAMAAAAAAEVANSAEAASGGASPGAREDGRQNDSDMESVSKKMRQEL